MIEAEIEAARNITVQRLQVMPIWLSRTELTRSILERNGNVEQVDLWITQRKIFAVEHHGVQHFAKFQFSDTYEPREVIAEILDIFDSKDVWALTAWFVFPNGWIPTLDSGAERSAAPMQALDNEDAVLQAARNEKMGTSFA